MTLIMCVYREGEVSCSHEIANGGHYLRCPFHTTETAGRICKWFEPKQDEIYKVVTTTDETCVAVFMLSEDTQPQLCAEELMKELFNVKLVIENR